MSELTMTWLIPMIISLVFLFVVILNKESNMDRLTFFAILLSAMIPFFNIIPAVMLPLAAFLNSGIGEKICYWIDNHVIIILEWLDKPLINKKHYNKK